MNIEEKISVFLKEQKVVSKSVLRGVKVSEDKNKKGENLFYVRADQLEKPVGLAFSNDAIYFGFNSNGDYVGCVRTSVLNVKPPSKVEIEYWANDQFKNQGNITVLAGEVIKEIFEEKSFDGLRVRNVFPVSEIDSIVVSINDDNYASLAVAKKLGFDDNGCLNRSAYFSSKGISTGVK